MFLCAPIVFQHEVRPLEFHPILRRVRREREMMLIDWKIKECFWRSIFEMEWLCLWLRHGWKRSREREYKESRFGGANLFYFPILPRSLCNMLLSSVIVLLSLIGRCSRRTSPIFLRGDTHSAKADARMGDGTFTLGCLCAFVGWLCWFLLVYREVCPQWLSLQGNDFFSIRFSPPGLSWRVGRSTSAEPRNDNVTAHVYEKRLDSYFL